MKSRKSKKTTIESLDQKIEQLPMLPGVAARLLALDRSSQDYFEDVVRLTEQDPPFAVRLLQLANSADSAPASPVTTLHGAVTRLGAQRITSLAGSIALMDVFIPSTDVLEALWIHAAQTAVAARTLARLKRDSDVEPENAYLAGLLHDIGRFVISEEMPDELATVEASGWSNPQDLVAAEKEMLGFDHAELGWHAAVQWGLPADLCRVIHDHHGHESLDSDGKPEPVPQLVLVVQMADLVSLHIMQENPVELDEDALVERTGELCLLPEWDEAPVSPRQLAPEIPRIIEDSRALLEGIGIGG